MTDPIKSKEIDAKAAKAAAEDAALLEAAEKKAAEAQAAEAQAAEAQAAAPTANENAKDKPKKSEPEVSYAGKMVRAVHGTMVDASNAHAYTQTPGKVHEDNGWLRYQIANGKIEVVND